MFGNSFGKVVAAATLLAAGLPATSAEANFFGLFRTRHRQEACCGPAPAVVQYRAAYVAPATCSTCQPAMTVAAAPVAPACTTCQAPAPISVPETCMQTRCYQVPVTTYETRVVNQLVTENQVRQVMEPVTTMQTSTYFDPCNCGYQTVNTPVTTMVPRNVVTPIQRYVAQHVTVPVTKMVQQCEQVPVTQYRMYMPAGVAPAAAVAVPAPAPVAVGPPAVQQQQPQTIQMPVPATPNGDANSQKPTSELGKAAYPPNYENYPDRREVIERQFENGKLIDQRWRLEDKGAAGSSSTGNTTGQAPLTPRPAPPPTTGSSYAQPVEQKPMPQGVKQASWQPGYNGTVTLSKPYVQ